MNANVEISTSDGLMRVQVRCSNKKCGATAPNGVFSTQRMDLKKAEKKAIEAWNKRAPKRELI